MSATYSAIRVGKANDLDTLVLEELPIPELKEGEVLVKLEFASVNPSDIYSAYGTYPRGPFPYTVGLEGSGTVVQSGGGELADSLVGKRVTAGNGTWATHVVNEASRVFPLLDTTTSEQGAGLIVNPLTVVHMIEKVKQGNHKAIIQNAAASALGKMLARWAKILGIPIVNIVRRQEQVDALKSIGAEHVFNSSEPDWRENAKAVTESLGATIAFDAIGGDSTNDIAELLSSGGVVYNYGLLSGQNPSLSTKALIFERKRLEGLWLNNWLFSNTHAQISEALNTVQNLLTDVFGTEHGQIINLTQAKDIVVNYNTYSKTNNKFLIRTTLD
jgi:NADPH:quinone reductase